ncbi:MAG: arylsulfatase [Pseudomonadales bacterium]|nr:arylsulfatase [Pseudomonadales bacterium]
MDEDLVRRAILPMLDEQHVGLTTYDAKDPDTSYPPMRQLRPPAGAPNVLVVLLDDVGFGASSAFGGPCATPTAERLAAGGVRLNRFHTTALCAPTRQALLTGRNHHSVGMGAITEMATAAPGNNSVRPKDKAPIAETLRLNGYSTAQFGKCHEVPAWQVTPMGPFDQWPTGSGFEHFYGFVGGEANQYYPGLYEGTTPVEPPRTPEDGYTLTEDLADRAITWVRQQKALMPDKPFFVYFAPGATHAPHHVPQEWSDRYRGRFDEGWDVLREQTFARQQELGVVPPDAELTARHDEIPAWDDMPDELKPVLARQMEIYAGFLEQTDHEVGRLVDAIDDLGLLEDTLVFYIIGDNGASAEGTVNGAFNEMTTLNGMPGIESVEFLLSKIDDFGTPAAYNHYSVGWAHAMCTPYQWTKQVASHFGGTRNGMVMAWPARITDRGGIRTQFHHVIDVVPTILEVAGIQEPETVDGIKQSPIEGTSFAYTFKKENAKEPSRHKTQYFEMMGQWALYHEGRLLSTKVNRAPWEAFGPANPDPLNNQVLELYDLTRDFSQSHNIAEGNPDRVQELKEMFIAEAKKYQVFPMDASVAAKLAQPRPNITAGRSEFVYTRPMIGLPQGDSPSILNSSYTFTAEITVPEGGAEGMIVTSGGRFCGYGFYLLKGKPVFLWNMIDLERIKWEGPDALAPGKHVIEFDFKYDGLGAATLAFNNMSGLAQSGVGTLKVDGKVVDSKKVPKTIPMILQWDEAFDIGSDTLTGVNDSDYKPPFNLTAKLDKLTLKVDRPQLAPEDIKKLKDGMKKIEAGRE